MENKDLNIEDLYGKIFTVAINPAFSYISKTIYRINKHTEDRVKITWEQNQNTTYSIIDCLMYVKNKTWILITDK